MIAITKQVHQDLRAKRTIGFSTCCPEFAARHGGLSARYDQNTRTNWSRRSSPTPYCQFVRLVRRGKADVAFATPLANYAIRQVIAGRRVADKPRLRDVMSPQARAAHGFAVERLDRFDEKEGEWRQVLVEDGRSTPAEIAAARIDVAAWLRSLLPETAGSPRLWPWAKPRPTWLGDSI